MSEKNFKKLKLLFCINSLSAKGGGAEKILSIISKELSDYDKYHISIISFDNPGRKFFYKFSNKIKIYKLGNLEIFKGRFFKNINRIIIMMIYMFKIKPNISFGFMHSNYINLSFASIFSKSKIVACEHIVPQHFTNKRLEFFLIKLSSFFFDKISVVSTQVKKLFPLILQKKMIVLNNFVDLVDKPHTKQNRNRFKRILSVGRLEDQKNFLTLIYAFNVFQQKFNDWKLDIIGDGWQKKNIVKQIKNFKIEKKIRIINFKKNLNQDYLKSSFYVCSSIYESFGLTVAEALLHNLPVIAFKKCTGVNNIIKHQKNGILINAVYYDYQNLALAMIKLASNKKLIKQLSNYNNKKIFEENSKKLVVKKWIRLINTLSK